MGLSDSEIKGAIPCGPIKEKPSMVKIIRSETSTEGYAINDNGQITDLTEKNRYIDKRRPDTLYYHLPQNSANRQYIAADKLVDGLVLEYKESRPTGARSVEKFPIEHYMTADELAMYYEIINNAKARKAEAEKPKQLTALEKAQLAYEKAKAEVERLTKESAAE